MNESDDSDGFECDPDELEDTIQVNCQYLQHFGQFTLDINEPIFKQLI